MAASQRTVVVLAVALLLLVAEGAEAQSICATVCSMGPDLDPATCAGEGGVVAADAICLDSCARAREILVAF